MKVNARTALIISDPEGGDEKLVLDRAYFDELVSTVHSAVATLAITIDYRLFSRILAAANTLDADVRKSKLHSFETAFRGK